MRAVVIVLFAAALAPACRQRTSEATTTGAPVAAADADVAPPAPRPPAPATRSAEHFGSSMALLGATVTGNVAAFHEAASALEGREIPANASEAWTSRLEPMREAAAHATGARSVEDAARALGQVGAACAACHRALGAPHVEVGRPPPRSSARLRMARHAWAAQRMWEGLSAPSDASWTAGATVLEDARLEPEVVTSAASVDPEVSLLARRTHGYGRDARHAKDDTARANALAGVYGTCAHCHRALGVDLSRPRR